jgi:cation transport regulator ChaB
VLTTQLVRAVQAERDYVDGQIEVLKQRLDGIDRATEVLNETVNRVPTDVQQAVGHLRSLVDEKFTSVGTQFKERDTRSERESRDNKVAVDAAFAAQKEAAAKQDESNAKAIAKSEATTAETIRNLATLVDSGINGLRETLDDLKVRLARIEAAKIGGQEVTTERRDANAALYAAAGFVLTVLVIIGVLAVAGVFSGKA